MTAFDDRERARIREALIERLAVGLTATEE